MTKNKYISLQKNTANDIIKINHNRYMYVHVNVIRAMQISEITTKITCVY